MNQHLPDAITGIASSNSNKTPAATTKLAVAFVDEGGNVKSANKGFFDAIQADEAFPGTLSTHLSALYPDQRNEIESAFNGVDAQKLELRSSRIKLQLTLSELETGQRVVQINLCQLEAAVRHDQVYSDSLTNLGNRRLLDEILDKRKHSEQPLAMIMMDLDRFKQINDTLGHSVGDSLLELVAKRTMRTTRENDAVIRLGGDEFIILHESGETTASNAQRIAGRLVEMMGRPFLINGQQLNIGASVGIAILNEGTTHIEDLMRHADLALYAAKDAGRNNYQMFVDALEQTALARRELEIQLRRALSLKEFELVYQPQVDMPAGKLTGFEALIRWNSSHRGLISPDEFIPLAEETGEIISIGDWVLETACLEATRWADDLVVAVNVSPVQFTTDKFVDSVTRALHKSGLPPNRLEIEITETVLINKPEQALEHLMAIRDMGVSIAMDDFGTGYSSLSYLNNFPFSKIKIDRAFVSENQTSKSQALVNAIITLGASLGMKTLAEGVETAEQFDQLSQAGCIAAQGYLISRPLQAADLNRFVVEHDSSRQNKGTES